MLTSGAVVRWLARWAAHPTRLEKELEMSSRERTGKTSEEMADRPGKYDATGEFPTPAAQQSASGSPARHRADARSGLGTPRGK